MQRPTFKLQYIIYILIVLIPLIIGVVVGEFGLKGGLIAVALSIGLPLLLASGLSIDFGISFLVIYSFTLSIIGRLTKGVFPVGTLLDILMVVIFIGIISSRKNQDKVLKTYLNHPVIILFILNVAYSIIQVINPSAVNLTGWALELRFTVYKIIAMYVLLNYFSTKKRVLNFIKLILILSILGGLYGLYHKYFGLFSFEDQWLRAEPKRYELIVLFGRMRIWSFFDGPTTFGLIMAYSAIFAFILAFSNVFDLKVTIGLVIAGIVMILGMIYSGTRTAFAILPIGMALYFLMTLNSPKTILISIGVMLIFGIVYFGPFYSPSIIRLRSAFESTDDPSMNIRVVNRHRIQPYIYSHLLGGGPGTTGRAGLATSGGHPLAGFPTDSYYLRTALEKGIPGLIITMALFLAVISAGVTHYYKCRDPIFKAILAALVCSFFSICIANYTQDAVAFRPMDIIVFGTSVLVIKIPFLGGKNI